MNIKTKKRLEEIINSSKQKNAPIQKDCQYLQNDSERYCKATTNTSCLKCKFYDPKYSVKAQLVVDALIASEYHAEQERKALTDMYEKKLDELRKNVTFYRTCGTAQ